jgi:hypothetical protein
LCSYEDQYWWQARKEVDKTTRAGLIPSRALQERRIIHERQNQSAKEINNESKSKRSDCLVHIKIAFPLSLLTLFFTTIIHS